MPRQGRDMSRRCTMDDSWTNNKQRCIVAPTSRSRCSQQNHVGEATHLRWHAGRLTLTITNHMQTMQLLPRQRTIVLQWRKTWLQWHPLTRRRISPSLHQMEARPPSGSHHTEVIGYNNSSWTTVAAWHRTCIWLQPKQLDRSCMKAWLPHRKCIEFCST